MGKRINRWIGYVIIFSMTLLLRNEIIAQSVGINSSGTSPDASAMLDVGSTAKGLLLPRMSAAQRDAIGSPATGLLVFVNDDNTFYYYNGTSWVPLFGDNAGWKTLGNGSTSAATNFLGTTDAVDLVLRTNNTEAMRIANGGNVGIGTTSPSVKLHVAGEITSRALGASSGIFSAYNTGGNKYFETTTASSNGIIRLYDASSNNDVQIHAGGDTYFNGGNVAIGHTSPSTILDITTNTNSATTVTVDNQSSGNAAESRTYFKSDGGGFYTGMASTTYAAFPILADRGYIYSDLGAEGISLVTSNAGGDIKFYTGGNTSAKERMSISNVGKVNIGVDGTPTLGIKLQVDGGGDAALGPTTGYMVIGDISSTNIVMDDNEIEARNNGSKADLAINADGGRISFHLNQDNGKRVNIEDNGNVGIGILNATSKLYVNNDASGSDSSFVVENNGNVGVGTAAPDTKFHIMEGTDASTSSGSGYLVTGSITSTNIVMDDNEIMARNNGTTSNLLVNLSGGNVGIGTATPDARLSISNGVDASLSSGAGYAMMGSTSLANLILDNNEIMARNNGAESELAINADGGDISFHSVQAGGTQVMIKDNGFVGVGTSSPSTMLHLVTNDEGHIRVNADGDNVNEAHTFAILYSQDGGLVAGQFGFNPFGNFSPDNTAYTGAVSNALLISNEYITDPNAGGIQFGTNQVHMTMDHAGNLGLGTNNPSSKFQLVGNMSQNVVTIAADDVTPDVSGGNILVTSANTGVTAITDLDNPVAGQIIRIIGGSATNPSTIADGGFFNLSAPWTANLDDVLILLVQADNDYIEIGRVNN